MFAHTHIHTYTNTTRRQRLLLGWYRQPEALLNDAQLLVLNAQLYTGEGTPVVQAAAGMCVCLVY